MKARMKRREFLKNMAVAGSTLSLGGKAVEAAGSGSTHEKSGFKKAVITEIPDEKTLEEVKTAGFDGVEANLWHKKDQVPTPEEAAKTRETAESMGMRVHSVLRGWAQFNSPDPEKVKEDIEFTKTLLRAAQGYGSDAILIVPGKIGGMKMPAKNEYAVRFHPETGHVIRLVEGDNSDYEECIQAHNHAWDSFHVALDQLIPVAEKTGVVLAVENVWNNLLLTPEHFAAFVDSFDTPWVQAYFDVANHISYGPPSEDWIRVLGKRIVKVHIKDYKINPPDGKEWPDLLEGDVHFPAVIRALKEVGYGDGWLTIEGSGGLSLKERSRRLDRIIASGG